MSIKWEPPRLEERKPSRDWAQKLLDRVEKGDWDYAKNGHIPIKMAEECLRFEV